MRALATLAVAATLSLAPAAAGAATLYLCKAYGGGSFWSTAQCSTQQATIERIVSVPDDMPFELQVQLGNQAVAEGARLAAPPPPPPPSAQGGKRSEEADECKLLDERIQRLDALARQPQSAATQDWIAERRRAARSRQFQLRCR